MLPLTMGDPNRYKPPQFRHFVLPYAAFIFVIGDRKDSKFDVKVKCASLGLRKTNHPW